jgi:hypothetical protein
MVHAAVNEYDKQGIWLTSIFPGVEDGNGGGEAADEDVQWEDDQEEHHHEILVPCAGAAQRVSSGNHCGLFITHTSHHGKA